MSLIKSSNDLEEYFIQLCREHVGIQHTDTKPRFHLFKGTNVGKNMSYPCIMWNNPEIGLIDQGSDNIHESLDWELGIIKPVKPDDRADRKKVIGECDEIAGEFIARLKKDRSIFPDKDRPFAGLNMNSIKRTIIGPFAPDNAFGIALSGTIHYPKGFGYDGAKWKK